jgi:hypothetical protein
LPSIVTVVVPGAPPLPDGCVLDDRVLVGRDDDVGFVVDDRELLPDAELVLWESSLLRMSTTTTAATAPSRTTLRTAMTINAVREEPVRWSGA